MRGHGVLSLTGSAKCDLRWPTREYTDSEEGIDATLDFLIPRQINTVTQNYTTWRRTVQPSSQPTEEKSCCFKSFSFD